MEKRLKICYIAGREATYSRTRIMFRALEKTGAEVAAVLPPDKRFKHYPGLIWRFLKAKRRCDLVVVGFYGQLLLPFVWLFSRKPILYDLYISTFDTMVHDRGETAPHSFKAKVYRFFDQMTMKMSRRIILETQDHIADYAEKFGVPQDKFLHLFLTVDEEVMGPQPEVTPEKSPFLVHFHGEFAPFHGVRTIIQAAHLLEEDDIAFQIIGRGITYDDDRQLADELGLQKIRFIDWVPYDELAAAISRAHCGLGFFGDNLRSGRVLTNKVVETLAVGRPLITSLNDPVQELVTDGESALLVPRGDAQALAGAILRLKEDAKLAADLGKAGRHVYETKCSMTIFSSKLKQTMEGMIAK